MSGGNILSWRFGANLRLMVGWFCEAIQVYGILEGYGTMKVKDALGLRDNCSLCYFWFKLRTVCGLRTFMGHPIRLHKLAKGGA